MSQNIVSALGAGSGIDTQALITSLVEIERSAPQERIDNKRTTAETQISDFGLINSALATLQTAATTLGNSDSFNSKAASFTDSTAFVPVSLEPEAQVGDYAFTVSQLAQSQSLSSAVFTNTTDAVGEGTLTFSFGRWDVVTPPANPNTFTEDATSTQQVITIDSSNNTLSGLAQAINDADFGVQASIVNDGSGFRLVMRADSGLDKQLQITAAESGGSPTNNDNADLSRFTFNASGFQMTQNQIGQDSQLTVNGLSVTRSTNTINDVIEGFEFTLSGTTGVGETVSVSIDEDKSIGETAVRDFFAAYNEFLNVMEPIVGYNEETEAYGSLANDSLAKGVPGQIRQLLVGTVTGLNSTFNSLTNVGIRTELDGTLSIDEDDFTDALENNYELFKNLFIEVRESTTDQITVNSTGTNTTEGQYAVVITQTPTKGNLVGADSADDLLTQIAAASSAQLTGAAATATLSDFVATSGNFTGGTASIPLNLATLGAGATDYDFTITVDGVASAANISVPVSDYASYAAMATSIQTQVNADANISGVTVTYDTDHFVFTSSTTGASSTVALAAVGPNANDLGIGTGSSTAGTGGANDYDFTIAVDGTTSGTISVTPGTYASFNDVATHLQTQINADATLTGAGASVTVTHNGSAFVITSASSGTSSTLANATAVGSQASTLGITSGSVVQGAGGNASSYNFTVAVNGTTSGTISITEGTYADKDALATEIQTRINADSALQTAGAAVTVTYASGTDSFTIQSTSYGSTSTVSVTNVGGSAADLGFSTGTATAGNNVAGTIDGVAGFGTGNVLLPALGQPAESMGLIIGESATSGTVNFSRGFGGQLQRLIEEFLDDAGVIQLREDALNDDIDDLDDDQTTLDRRIEAYQERLTSQFIAMEAIVRSLQSSSSFLESTLESLLNATTNNDN